ncbi:Nif3-like dinuclear metal center hexameric protein [Candidatus Woesearchaeota archaeon]|jgi:dinuclear metal center YbgI/SA1388 family protein|nr:Nif3-like dinuclear metal center hexameric protein [Candidatus Woesearchaeota archaeon]
MADLIKITEFLDKTLKTDEFVEENSHNGLQVQNNLNTPIKKIGFAVDSDLITFKKAKKAGCDLIIVHHGIFWNKKETITGTIYKKIKFLLDNNIALYASHLPLDKHIKYGNNANLMKLLNAKITSEFNVGYIGEFKKPAELKKIINLLNTKINTKCQVIKGNDNKIKTLAIISGGATFELFNAIKEKVDLYITGEISHVIYHPAKEEKINYICAGHYATETIGVKSLMPLLKNKFKIKTEFIENSTNL